MENKKTTMFILAIIAMSVLTLVPFQKKAFALSMVQTTDPNNYNVRCMGFQNSPHFIIAGVEDSSNSNRLAIRIYTANETSGILTLYRTIASTSIGAVLADGCSFFTVDANNQGEQSGNEIYVYGIPSGTASGIITRISITTGAILSQTSLDGTNCRTNYGLVTSTSVYFMASISGANNCDSDTGITTNLVYSVLTRSLVYSVATNTGIAGSTLSGISNCRTFTTALFSCSTSTGASDHVVYFDPNTSAWVTRGPATTDAMFCGRVSGSNIYCARSTSGVISQINYVTDVTTTWVTLASVDEVQLLATTVFAVVEGVTTLREYSTAGTLQASYTTPLNTNEISNNGARGYTLSYLGAVASDDTFTMIIYGEDIDDPEEDIEDGGAGQINGVCVNVDANGDGRINVLDCVGSVTAFEGFTSGRNATDVTATITDGLGLTNCGEDADHETCGSGLFMFIFALLIFEGLSLALYLGFTTRLGAEKQLVDILLIMLMIAFATLSLAFYLNWIPDIVFYAIVVLIAGFLAFGIVAKFRGG